MINRIKHKYIKKAQKKLLSDKEFDYNFGNSKKYHYTVVAKSNALLAKVSSNCDGDKFCLKCFHNFFQNEELLKKHKTIWKQ